MGNVNKTSIKDIHKLQRHILVVVNGTPWISIIRKLQVSSENVITKVMYPWNLKGMNHLKQLFQRVWSY